MGAMARRQAIASAKGLIVPEARGFVEIPDLPGRPDELKWSRYNTLSQLDRLMAPTLLLYTAEVKVFLDSDNAACAIAIERAKPALMSHYDVLAEINHGRVPISGVRAARHRDRRQERARDVRPARPVD